MLLNVIEIDQRIRENTAYFDNKICRSCLWILAGVQGILRNMDILWVTLGSGIVLPSLASVAGPGVAASLLVLVARPRVRSVASYPGMGSHPHIHLAVQWQSL